jgi:hypothetical protein
LKAFEALRTLKPEKVLDGRCIGVEEFYEKIIKPQFSHRDTIISIHNSLLEYINLPDPTFFLRLYGSFPRDKYSNQRRGFINSYKSGTRIVYCDNTFSLLFTGMKLHGIDYNSNDLVNLFSQRSLQVGFAQVAIERERSWYTPKKAIRYNLNTAGWYQAHIKPTGKDFADIQSLKKQFPNPDLEEFDKEGIRELTVDLDHKKLELIKAHFLRLIHPLNSFILPKGNHTLYKGVNLGEEPELLQFVKKQLRDQFSAEYQDFDKVTLGVKDELVIDKIGVIEWFKDPIEAEKKTVPLPNKTEQYVRNIRIDEKSKRENEMVVVQSGDVEHSSTRFFVDEKIYRKLISNPQSNFILKVTPNKGRHPRGVYFIPNQVIVNYIEIKRAAYNWQKNKTYHQDGVPKDLKTYFN